MRLRVHARNSRVPWCVMEQSKVRHRPWTREWDDERRAFIQRWKDGVDPKRCKAIHPPVTCSLDDYYVFGPGEVGCASESGWCPATNRFIRTAFEDPATLEAAAQIFRTALRRRQARETAEREDDLLASIEDDRGEDWEPPEDWVPDDDDRRPTPPSPDPRS